LSFISNFGVNNCSFSLHVSGPLSTVATHTYISRGESESVLTAYTHTYSDRALSH